MVATMEATNYEGYNPETGGAERVGEKTAADFTTQELALA